MHTMTINSHSNKVNTAHDQRTVVSSNQLFITITTLATKISCARWEQIYCISLGLSLMWNKYNILEGYSPPIPAKKIILTNCDHDFRNCDVLCGYSLPKYKTVCYGKRSLRYSGTVLWNTAPNSVKQAETCLE